MRIISKLKNINKINFNLNVQQQNYTHDFDGAYDLQLPPKVDEVYLEFGNNKVSNYSQFRLLISNTLVKNFNLHSTKYCNVKNQNYEKGTFVWFEQEQGCYIDNCTNYNTNCKTCYNGYNCYECEKNNTTVGGQLFSYKSECLTLQQCDRKLDINFTSINSTDAITQHHKCETPIENCKLFESLTKCRECKSNYFPLVNPGKINCSDNQTGVMPFQYTKTINGSQIIFQCVDNCIQCSNTTGCEVCSNNSKHNLQTGLCETSCPDGQKKIGGGDNFTCEPCKVDGCQSCESSIYQCDICDEGLYNKGDECSPHKCGPGYQTMKREIDYYCMQCYTANCNSCQNFYYKCTGCNSTSLRLTDNNTCIGCKYQQFYDQLQDKCLSCNNTKCLECSYNANNCTKCSSNQQVAIDGDCYPKCGWNEERNLTTKQCFLKNGSKSKMIYYIIGSGIFILIGLLILVLVFQCKKNKKQFEQLVTKQEEITTTVENIQQQNNLQTNKNNDDGNNNSQGLQEPLLQQEDEKEQQEQLIQHLQQQQELEKSQNKKQKQETLHESKPFLFSSGSNSGKSDNSTNSQSSIPNLQDTIVNLNSQQLTNTVIDPQQYLIKQSLMNQVSNQLQIKNYQNQSSQLQTSSILPINQQSSSQQQLGYSKDKLMDTQQTENVDSPLRNSKQQHQQLIIKNLEQSIQQQASNQTIRMDESSQFLQDNDVPTISMPEFKQKYELIDNLGEGSFGFVEKYYSHQLQKEVAIKRSKCFSHKDFFNQGAQEAIALKKMNKLCPYILKLEDCFVIGQKKEQQPPIINKKQWNNSEIKLQIKNDLQLCLDLGDSQNINRSKIKQDMQLTKNLGNSQLGNSMLGNSQDLEIQPKDNLQTRNNQKQQQVLGTSNMVSMFKGSQINMQCINEQSEENLNSQESKDRSNKQSKELKLNQEEDGQIQDRLISSLTIQKDSIEQDKESNIQEQQQQLQQSQQFSQYMLNKKRKQSNQVFQFGTKNNNNLSQKFDFQNNGFNKQQNQSGQLCLVLELGQYSLFDEIQQRVYHNIPFQSKELLQVAYETLTALNALHQFMKMAHRDIKPQNILFIDPHYKLCDLGIAKNYENSMSVTNNHTMSGTLNYFSPEEKRNYIYFLQNQEQEQQPFNVFKADIFALGLTMLQAATLQGITGLNDSIQKLQTALQVLFSIPYLDEKIKLLISGMLVWDAKQRLSAQQLLDIIAK